MASKSKLTTEELELAKQYARDDLVDFCYWTDPRYDASWHHEMIAQKLMELEQRKIKRLIISMPPRHGKSELASIKFPAWYLGHHPEHDIIQTSYAAELAKGFGEKTRDLLNDPQYHMLFDTRLKEDSKAKNIWRTQANGTYVAAGVGGPITGRGANVLIIDDPVKNREEAESQVIQEKVWNWYTSTAYTRLEKDAIQVIIMTRWHPYDLVGRILEQESDKWKTLELPAIAETNEEHRKMGDPLWPQKYPIEELKDIEATIGTRDWLALYQQHPVSSITQEFKEHWFRYFEEGDVINTEMDVWITCDPAISKRDEACNTAIYAVGREKGNPNWYILDEVADQLDPTQLIGELFRLARKYDPRDPTKKQRLRSAGIETVAYQQSLIYFMEEKMRTEGFYFDVRELRASMKKEERIRGLIPLYKTGVIFHRRSMKELEKELLEFPNGKLVDRPDALAYQLQLQDGTEPDQSRQQTAHDKIQRRKIQRSKHRAVVR